MHTTDQQADESRPYGDLSTLPPRDKWMWDEEIFALDNLIRLGAPSDQAAIFRGMIADLRLLLEKELMERQFLTQMVQDEVHPQLRARSDRYEPGKIVIEQWVPAVQCWLVSGKFSHDTPALAIIEELKAGDPRRKTPVEALAEARETAASTRARIDAESNLKVVDAVNSLPAANLDRFIEVETALKTGETISARGDDRAALDKAHARTLTAAAQGDIESQRVITQKGVRDTSLCVNPGDNPNVR